MPPRHPFLSPSTRAFDREDRPGGNDKDGAPASSGVEVISSEHYDVPDSGDVDGSVTAGKKRGEIPPDSAPTAAPGVERGAADGGEGGGDGEGEGNGARGEAGNAGGDGGRGAGSVLGVEGPEIMIRPPSYGFNDKVRFGSVRFGAVLVFCLGGVRRVGLRVGWT